MASGPSCLCENYAKCCERGALFRRDKLWHGHREKVSGKKRSRVKRAKSEEMTKMRRRMSRRLFQEMSARRISGISPCQAAREEAWATLCQLLPIFLSLVDNRAGNVVACGIIARNDVAEASIGEAMNVPIGIFNLRRRNQCPARLVSYRREKRKSPWQRGIMSLQRSMPPSA